MNLLQQTVTKNGIPVGLTVYIRWLRTKIEEPPQKIVAVRGLGYKWRVTP